MDRTNKPLILVSNDDGIHAKGINELMKYLRPLGEIIAVAPDTARSGSGCALSVTLPVHYQLLHQEPGITIYECTGTPTDCIKLARNVILKGKPDLIVGGINHGDNSATNVHYSGTMGIVIEGCLNGIPSIGFSLCNHEPDADFEPTCEYVRKIVGKILEKGLPPLVCLNVNFPDTKEIKGIKICEQTQGYWTQEWDACTCRENSYRLSGTFTNTQPNNKKNDRWALSQGYVAITPTKVDITAYECIDDLKNMLCDES
ncbi:5'-nucleotidase SurE [termite gut metagenome]|uniref:5'-nucleotidase SurE n=1 Tax=termite gut metagenome TaxID=433724 RepID=A0A5J4RQX9_9ZZZZ